jgi:hypothetical protein
VTAGQYPLHQQIEADVAASPERLFALLDDHARLTRHMERPSLMTAGGVFRVETDAFLGRAAGSVIRMSGTVLGIGLSVEEVVTEYRRPFSKVWKTLGKPRLLVIGAYRMGFNISPRDDGSRLTVFIDYRWPEPGVTRLFGRLLGKAYARWCTRRMVKDAVRSFRITRVSS